jgi:RNA polymerase sigma-70 factor (ECF subfamily)
MSETSASLLDRLRDGADTASWQRFVDLYTPVIRGWLRHHALLEQDSDDIAQEVLAVVVRKLPQFQREPRTGAFRRWLRTITVNCLRDFWRSKRRRPVATGDSNFLDLLSQLEDPESPLSREWEEEHDRVILRRLLEMVKPQFEPSSWQAFQRLALDGAPSETVAGELGMSINAVQIAKSRILARLRQESDGLID